MWRKILRRQISSHSGSSRHTPTEPSDRYSQVNNSVDAICHIAKFGVQILVLALPETSVASPVISPPTCTVPGQPRRVRQKAEFKPARAVKLMRRDPEKIDINFSLARLDTVSALPSTLAEAPARSCRRVLRRESSNPERAAS
jgi:hypothetical protein